MSVLGTIDFNPDGSEGLDFMAAGASPEGAFLYLSAGNGFTTPLVKLQYAALYDLDVVKAGSGAGTVTSDVGGIDCGTTCSASIVESTASVVLTAAPASGSTFAGWSGACSGAATTCTVAMGAALTLDPTDRRWSALRVGARVLEAMDPAAARACMDGRTESPLDRLRVVQRQPVGRARAAVMRQHAETVMPEMAHQADGIARHLALGIGGAAFAGRRAVAVAIAAQVHQHDTVRARQRGRHTVPHRHRLRMAVQKQQGRPAGLQRAALAGEQRDAVTLHGQR